MMLARSRLITLLVIYGSRRVLGQVVPTTPGPNETYTAGSFCAIAWVPDTSGSWKNVTIDLMSGSNSNMSFVKNVASVLDGTDTSLTPYNWTCPEVDPYSNIYFYQFTNGIDTSTRAWTTRFTIISPMNETQPAENAQQPNGDNVPWGIGHVDDSKPSSNSSVTAATVSSSEQSTLALPASSSSAPSSASSGTRKKPHGHKGDGSDSDYRSGHDRNGDEGEDGEDSEEDNQEDMIDTPSRTHSSAARATDTARSHSGASSSNDASAKEPDVANSDDSDGAPRYHSEGSYQAQSSFPDSNEPMYKNSGAADGADSAFELGSGCRCGPEYASHRTSGAGPRLLRPGYVSSVVIPIMSALVVALV